MYKWKIKHTMLDGSVEENEFESKSAYLDQTTLAYVQIYLNTITGDENIGLLGIISINPADESVYGAVSTRKKESKRCMYDVFNPY